MPVTLVFAELSVEEVRDRGQDQVWKYISEREEEVWMWLLLRHEGGKMAMCSRIEYESLHQISIK